jgi:hypothetical protein
MALYAGTGVAGTGVGHISDVASAADVVAELVSTLA